MARKAVKKTVKEDSSDLSSPPPEPAPVQAVSDGTPASKKRKRATNPAVVKTEEPEAPADDPISTPSNRTRKRKAVEYNEDNEEEIEPSVKPAPKAKTPRGKKAKVEEPEEVDEDVKPAAEKKVQRKRMTKEEKEAEAMPLAARTVGHKMFVGAHVSAAGGVHNAIANSVHIGANAFALFLKSQRKWTNPPLADDHCTSWLDNCKHHSYDAGKHVLPHGSYLVNLAHTDPERTKQAYDTFLDDLKRCERLGIQLYNFHPGNVAGKERPEAIAHLAKNINRAHKETSSVITVLENMAAGGNVIGSTFEDLRDVIALVDDKSRVGVCLDTCHAFAAGYDLRSAPTLAATLQTLDDLVGMQYLKALHMNDSKAPFNSRRDLHANIGTGFLGLRAFHAIMNEPRFAGLPLVLETPIDARDADGNPIKDAKGKETEDKSIWATEIKMLESLVGMDIDSSSFLELEVALAKKGAPERARVQDQVTRREEKAVKTKTKPKRAGKKKGVNDEMSEGDDLSDEE